MTTVPAPPLPEGLSGRPLTPADVPALVRVIAAYERAATGASYIQEADIHGDWGRPSFDVTSSTLGVFDGADLLGYAEVNGPARGDAAVHPAHEGRGIGTALARWMQDAARAQGQTEIGMPVPQGSSGERLLRALGYHERWTSWLLELPAGAEITPQPLPPGYVLRNAVPDDVEPAYHVVEDAFLEWSVRDKQDLADWTAQVVGRPGHQPWNLQVALDGSGQVVGAVHVTADEDGTGFVDKLAVRSDQRGRGLARALLASAFAAARVDGNGRSQLSTDSRTDALDLYRGLGMVVESTWVNLGIALQP